MRWDDFRRSDNIEDDREAVAAALARRRLRIPGRARRSRHRHRRCARSDRLGAWHRSQRSDRRRRNHQRRRRALPAAASAAAAQTARRAIRPASSSPPCSAIPRTSGTRSSSAAAGNTARRALRLYRGGEQGGCGFAQAAMGPFYCPRDQRIYLDTSFFREMQVRFHGCTGKACEFAEAYVIAHEVGHHVQNLLGMLPKATPRSSRRQQGGGQPAAGAGRIAGRLPRRRLGASFRPALEVGRAGRRRGGAADRGGDRRRPPAEAGARLRGARRLHPRHLGAAPALVHRRAEEGKCRLRHLPAAQL